MNEAGQFADYVGRIDQAGVSDFLTLLSLKKLTGSVEIVFDSVTGKLWFKEGELVHAECSGLSGLDAALRLIAVSGGTFRFTSTIETPARSITLPLNHVLLDAATKIDEIGRAPLVFDISPRARALYEEIESLFSRMIAICDLRLRSGSESVRDFAKRLTSHKCVRHAGALPPLDPLDLSYDGTPEDPLRMLELAVAELRGALDFSESGAYAVFRSEATYLGVVRQRAERADYALLFEPYCDVDAALEEILTYFD